MVVANPWLNLVRPGRREAYWVTFASVIVAAFFWMICLLGAINGHGTVAIVENGLESLLDFGSTLIVLYRLSAPDALLPTPRNEIIESRVSVGLGITMTLLGLLLITMSLISVSYIDLAGPGDVSLEAAMSVPAALLYIVIGMIQLQIGWLLDIRSLKQDAIISLLGSVVAMGSLAAALVNLILCAKRSSHTRTPAHVPEASVHSACRR